VGQDLLDMFSFDGPALSEGQLLQVRHHVHVHDALQVCGENLREPIAREINAITDEYQRAILCG
jgi:hypothetical protein